MKLLPLLLVTSSFTNSFGFTSSISRSPSACSGYTQLYAEGDETNSDRVGQRAKRAVQTIGVASAVALTNNFLYNIKPVQASEIVKTAENDAEATQDVEKATPSASKATRIEPKRSFGISNIIPDFTNLVKSTHKQTAEERIAQIPVFCVCTPWGSPYMVYDDAGQANALYFLDHEDAKCLLDEFLNMEGKDRDARIMTTTLARAMVQAANVDGVATGQITMDGVIQAMYYKIVPSTKELFYASKLPGKEAIGMSGMESEFTVQERIYGSIGDGDDTSGKSAAKGRAKFYRQKHKSIVADKKLTDAGIPVFSIEGMQFKTKGSSFIPSRKGVVDTPLFLSYNDCIRTYKEMRSNLSTEDKASIPANPEVEVFNMIDVVTSIDRDITRRDWSKEEKDIKTGLESIVFVPNSKSVDFVDSTSKHGNGKARLPDMQ
uniref:Uncharacterized protein n=1 Tax=Leptocylindrus danicus TaxID=163516 RepID=A0A7S2K0X3_9STRA